MPSPYYASSLGMGAIIDSGQVAQRNLSVFLSGRQPRVAQQFLNGAQIGAIGKQVRRVGVPEAVGVRGRIAGQMRGVELDDEANATRAQPVAERICEQGHLAELCFALGQITVERRAGLRGIGNLALLAPLASDAQPALA